MRCASLWTLVVLSSVLGLPRAVLGQDQTFNGTLTIVWVDPIPGVSVGSETHYILTLPDGRTARLQLTGQEALARSLVAGPVAVTGQLVRGAAGADPRDVGTVAVASIAPSGQGTPRAAVTGSKRVIYVLAKFPEDTDVPHPPSFYLELNNGDTPPPGSQVAATVNGFFKKTSWNQLTWIGDVGGAGGVGAPGGWLTLPHPRSFYVPCPGCFPNLGDLQSDVLAAGRAQGIDFALFDQANFAFSNDLNGHAFGGGTFVDGKYLGMTWLEPTAQTAWTLAHEMGHSLGLQHNGWVYFPYDSPWDTMSFSPIALSQPCGSYLSALNGGQRTTLFCQEPGSGYIAGNTEDLGWLPPANIVTTDLVTPRTVTLEALSLPLGAAAKMIKICIPASPCFYDTSGLSGPRHYLTVEARVRGLGATTQYDNGLLSDGVVIHEFGPERPTAPCTGGVEWPAASPFDSTPGDYDSVACNSGGRSYPDYALFNSQFLPGQSLTLRTFGIRIDVLSRTNTTFTVSIVPLPIPIITSQPADTLISSGQSATFNVVATSDTPLTYQWYLGQRGDTTRPIAGAISSSYTTPPRTSTARFWVRVGNSDGSTDSTSARATVAFTDNTLVPGVTPVRALHVTELRSRVDALRARFNLTPYVWNDFCCNGPPTPIVAGISIIRWEHVRQLRNALLELLYACSCGASLPPYSEPSPQIVKAVHFDELRNAVHEFEEK